MTTRTVLESDLRVILRDESRFGLGTVSFCEYGKGGDAGLPDAWIATPPFWTALELKRGRGVVSQLRPSQVRWHKNSARSGILTYGAALDPKTLIVSVYRFSLHNGKLIETLLGVVPSTDLNHSVLCGFFEFSGKLNI